ncbi:MAG: dihydroxyacetone kinase subunit DhaK [Lachnospiraceae bacterium]|nr:dihydroxyacetone kinase subunit DhaK [Lachnospiraceae bacterium]
MKYLSNPDFITKDCADGLALVYPELVQTLPDSFNGRILLSSTITPNRVNLIVSSGGGGGPFSNAFAASPDLADAVVNGNICTAPSAYDIYEAVKKINSPHGYLLMYNNFMGDWLNNDLALELIETEGYKGCLIPICDDCLSVPEDAPRSERTGLIGILYAVKIAAASARTGASLKEIAGLIEHVNQRMSSVMVTFDFEKKLTMLGEGISGEPARLIYEDQFTLEAAARLAYDVLYKDLEPEKNEKIYILINRNQYTLYEDAFILSKHLYGYSQTKTPIHQMSVGYYDRMSESYGFSVTMLCADARIDPFMRKRCFTESFIV